MKSTRKPFNDCAGYVASKRTGPRLSNGKLGWVVIYDARPAHLCDKGGRWVASCETHSTLANHTSLRAARASMKAGSHNWCDACRTEGTGPLPLEGRCMMATRTKKLSSNVLERFDRAASRFVSADCMSSAVIALIRLAKDKREASVPIGGPQWHHWLLVFDTLTECAATIATSEEDLQEEEGEQ